MGGSACGDVQFICDNERTLQGRPNWPTETKKETRWPEGARAAARAAAGAAEWFYAKMKRGGRSRGSGESSVKVEQVEQVEQVGQVGKWSKLSKWVQVGHVSINGAWS